MNIEEYHLANIEAWIRRNDPTLPELIVKMRAEKIHNLRIKGLKERINLVPTKKMNVKPYIY